MEKAQRMDVLLVAHVALRGLLDGADAGEHISVSMHDALGIAGGARSKEDLQGRVAIETGDRARFFDGESGVPVLK